MSFHADTINSRIDMLASGFVFLGLSIQDWGVVATAIFTGLMWYYLRKQTRMGEPRIVDIVEDTEGFGIIIGSPSQTGISITDVYLRKPFHFGHIKCDWRHPVRFEGRETMHGWQPIMFGHSHYVFSGYEKCRVIKPDIDSNATYKVFVKTTGGRCSAIYHPLSDQPRK